MNKQIKHFYEFGEFRLDVSRRRFYRGEEVVTLTPRVFDLLIVLIQHQGQVLEKSYLLSEVWSDVSVEEHSLTQAISVLRKVLGDKQNNHRYVMTVTGRGYQFVASATEITEDDDVNAATALDETRDLRPNTKRPFPLFVTHALDKKRYIAASFLVMGLLAGIVPSWLSSKASQPALLSIGIKPFHAVDKESCQTGLSMALTDALITKLSRLEEVTVVPLEHTRSTRHQRAGGVHTPDMHASEPGSMQDSLGAAQRRSGPEAIIEGHVQKLGEKFRVTVRMINMADGVSLWADQFEADEARDDEVHDRISGAVAQIVRERNMK